MDYGTAEANQSSFEPLGRQYYQQGLPENKKFVRKAELPKNNDPVTSEMPPFLKNQREVNGANGNDEIKVVLRRSPTSPRKYDEKVNKKTTTPIEIEWFYFMFRNDLFS